MKLRTLVSALALGAFAFTSAGCASIGMVNGIPVSRSMAMEDERTWCTRNKALCILGMAVGVGLITYGVSELYDDDAPANNGGNGNGNGNGGGGENGGAGPGGPA